MSPTPRPVSRRGLLAAAGAATALGLLRFAPGAAASDGPTAYTASWPSVDQHPPAPAWFQDAKFGIYYHWGAFSVPAFGNEWYPRTMYNSGSSENQHHIATYGDPSVWPYSNFIDGARDRARNPVKFAPKLVSKGGNWDPNAWARLFKAAGARFAGPVAEHHDGFSMWNSRVNPWNSVQRGPRLDLLGLQGQAIRGQGLKFMAAMHHAYNFNGFYEYVPYQSDPTLRILYGQQGAAAENQLWYDKLAEVVDGYQPDLIWQDFALDRVDEAARLKFLSYYYNKAVSWNKDVVATYKDGFDDLGEVYDFERGGPSGLLTPYWLTDDSISSSSWCYTVGIGYYTPQAMLHSLIDRVSKGGTVLLNIAPMADGTIPADQQSVLLGMGDWLGRFGEAVYATRAWSTYGEGPTPMGGGSFSGPKAGTAQDIRFTRSQDNTVLYATALGWQGGTMTIATLGSDRINLGGLTRAQLLGNTAGTAVDLPAPVQDGSGLHLAMPSTAPPFPALAYTVKLTFAGRIPALGAPAATATWVEIANARSGLALDGGGDVAAGADLGQWAYDGSPNLQWQLVDLGNGYYRITNRTNGMAADSWGDSGNGARARQAPWNGGHNQQWAFNSVGDGRYQIVNRGTGTALDGGGSTAPGAPAVLWAPNPDPNNEWTVTGS
ncbi:alpha-L-fucosidase [Kitasatospora cineracea]|uniref:alpha-L-fucosidase n=1 Tax=Kitasatospora cineracea TaxID=88074 RepID=A0A8G1X9R1_9ACTN|nr:alpha-L-fucosidase [Kitasatospora cineracea]ROR38055.1 alpha-L-fucosidase [Kitasatospora cineracea]